MRGLVLAGALCTIGAAAAAQPVVGARVVPGGVGPRESGNALDPASSVSWFTFTVPALGTVDIDINRTTAPTDLVAALFRGDVRGVDMTAITPNGLANDLFNNTPGDTFGPLTYLGDQDDTEDDPFGGPFGDPRFHQVLTPGTYSLMVTSFQPAEGGPFEIIATGVSGLVYPTALQGGLEGPYYAFEDNANPASAGTWFRFTLPGRANVRLDVARTAAPFDPTATLFAGDVTGQNATAISPNGRISGFAATGPFGPLFALDWQDDTVDDPFGGPFGDPRFTRVLDAGTYSVMVGMALPATGGEFTIESFTIHPQTIAGGTYGPYFAPEAGAGIASGGAWFRFGLNQTATVDIDINRTAAPPDLVAALFEGDPTGYGDSISPDGRILGLLSGDGPFGPLTSLDVQDDTEDDPFGGPFGDPRFHRTLGPGFYSVLVGSLSPTQGGDFTITSSFVGPCNSADVAPPFGVLDLSDVVAFIAAFQTQDPAADIAAPFGVFDLSDVVTFIDAFQAGCP
ncbi:MAG: hypothetical protein H6810_05785 [Phycisphaeraceae bacterium]|nr:MAG: hypothetical protein H6810_05785 [Phycisphaeraceae bacterium]